MSILFEHDDELRYHIIKTALMQFSNFGYDAVSMERLAQSISLPPGQQISSYFQTKQELMDAILDSIPRIIGHYSPSREELEKQYRSESPREMLTHFTSFYFRSDVNLRLTLYRLLFMEAGRSDKTSRLSQYYLVDCPTGNLMRALDFLVEKQAIPPCDSRALAELWTRSSLSYAMFATHKDNQADINEFTAINRFVMELALYGVKPLSTQEIEMTWDTTFFAQVDPPGGGPDEPKTIIADKALDLFERDGYTAVTLQRIAEECGLTLEEMMERYYMRKGDIMKDIVQVLLNSHKKFRLDNPAFLAAICNGDIRRVILTLSSSFPPVGQGRLYRLYRLLFREQYFDETLRDYFVGSLYRESYAVCETLDKMVQKGRISPCSSWEIALVYVLTMCSMTVDATHYPEREKEINQMRVRIVAPLISCILYGYVNPPT